MQKGKMAVTKREQEKSAGSYKFGDGFTIS